MESLARTPVERRHGRQCWFVGRTKTLSHNKTLGPSRGSRRVPDQQPVRVWDSLQHGNALKSGPPVRSATQLILMTAPTTAGWYGLSRTAQAAVVCFVRDDPARLYSI